MTSSPHMSRRIRRLAAFGSLISTVLLTAGCTTSSGTSSSNSPAPSGSTPAAATAPAAGGAVTIGLINDYTGTAGLFGPATKNVAQLAVEQINKAGGVDGRQVSLQIADGASDPTVSKADASRLTQSEHAAALFGMYNSAQSAAVLSVAKAAKVPYFYAPVWQGGVCDPNLFANGEVPTQQVGAVIPWVQQTAGKKTWFLLGDDYAWPHETFVQAKKYIAAAGGTVVGEDYVPLGTTDFSAEVSKMQNSGANVMIPALVGSDAIAFEKQAFDAGLTNEKVQRLAILYEDNTRKAMGPQITAGMYFATGYDQVLDTPANTAFLAAYRAKFGTNAPPVTTLSEQTYVALLAWAKAANAAKSTDLAAITAAMKGLSVAAPAGTVSYGPSRYAAQPIYVDQIGTDGTAKIVKSFPNVDPQQTCAA